MRSSPPLSGARCVNGSLVRPDNSEEESPSTACRQSAVHASGRIALGRGPSAFGKSPGIIPGRQLPPPPPPPPPPPVPHAPAVSNAATYPRAWTSLNSKAPGGGGPPDGTGGGTGAGVNGHSNSGSNPHPGGGASGSNGSGGGAPGGGAPPQEEAIQEAMPAAARLQGKRSSQEEQVVQAVRHQPLQAYLILADMLIHGLHWTDSIITGKLYRSSPCPPILRVAAYWTCSRF